MYHVVVGSQVLILLGVDYFAHGAVSHDFDDPDAAHSKAGYSFEAAGDRENALKAFKSAAHFNPSAGTLGDLGVCKMRHGLLEEAEVDMLKAQRMAKTKKEIESIDGNLDALEAHILNRRGEEVHSGMSYRRRSNLDHGKKRKKGKYPMRQDSEGHIYKYADNHFGVCPDVVVVSGSASIQAKQSARFGTYKVDRTLTPHENNAQRPIYRKSSRSQYLFYWEPFSAWRIGNNYRKAVAGIASRDKSSACPTEVVSWRVWEDGAWSDTKDVEVKEGEEEGPMRPELLHDKSMYRGLPFPRVTAAELDTNASVVRGMPFIFVGGTEGWKMMDKWPKVWRRKLAKLFPTAVTDFYPWNMLSSDRQSPYLTRLPKAIKELEAPENVYHFGATPRDGKKVLEGRYMHLQLTTGMWKKLESLGDITSGRHPFLLNDAWFEGCMNEEVADEWHLKTHWKIILTGTRGAGMFNHSDSLRTSSWHAHVMGDKWWYVCGVLHNGTNQCYEDILRPGEILYYPPLWHHETQCLSTPTMTLTDTVAHDGNVRGILKRFHGECTGRNPLNFDVSAQLCDAVERCAEWWAARMGKKMPKDGGGTWPRPWRKHALPERLAKAEKMKPSENNYDGRNYITER